MPVHRWLPAAMVATAIMIALIWDAFVDPTVGCMGRKLSFKQMRAGMPAEVFVATPPRSLLVYLLEPLDVFARRAMREP